MHLVLVAEDDETSRRLIQQLLERSGQTVIAVADGQTAWEVLRLNPAAFSLLVTDLNMPGIDGHELIARITANDKTRDLPVIVQSAYLGVAATRKLMECGVDAVLPKPVDGRLLLDYVARMLRKSRAVRAL